jgi:hypothetical protein
MKRLTFLFSVMILLFACSTDTKKNEPAKESTNTLNDIMNDTSQYAANEKGVGKFTDVKLDPVIDKKSAAVGSGIYDLKCSSCHTLTKERVVGPGWDGVTARRKPEWILNFITNTDEMLDKDPEAQAMLETCLVRMPNQSLSDDDARHVLEFMRKNDEKIN